MTQDTQTTLFAAPVDATAQLTDWVCLGTLEVGGQCQLTVSLDVPVTLDNAFANAVGALDWEFAVEELPENAKTGDTSPLALWVILLVLSAAAVIWLLSRKKKG